MDITCFFKERDFMEEFDFQTVEIHKEDLMDLIHCARTRTLEFWKEKFPLLYLDVINTLVLNHPIIDQFKFFTVYPACMYFYVDEQGNLRKEAVAVKSKVFDENEFVVNSNTMILLGLSKKMAISSSDMPKQNIRF